VEVGRWVQYQIYRYICIYWTSGRLVSIYVLNQWWASVNSYIVPSQHCTVILKFNSSILTACQRGDI